MIFVSFCFLLFKNDFLSSFMVRMFLHLSFSLPSVFFVVVLLHFSHFFWQGVFFVFF